MNKCVILCGQSLFWCELSEFWNFMKTDEETNPLHCVVMTIFQGLIILTGHYMEVSAFL